MRWATYLAPERVSELLSGCLTQWWALTTWMDYTHPVHSVCMSCLVVVKWNIGMQTTILMCEVIPIKVAYWLSDTKRWYTIHWYIISISNYIRIKWVLYMQKNLSVFLYILNLLIEILQARPKIWNILYLNTMVNRLNTFKFDWHNVYFTQNGTI